MNGAGVWIRVLGTGICGSFDPPQFGFSLDGTSQVRLVTQCIKGPCPRRRLHARGLGHASLSDGLTSSTTTPPAVAITGGSAVTPGWKSGTVDIGGERR